MSASPYRGTAPRGCRLKGCFIASLPGIVIFLGVFFLFIDPFPFSEGPRIRRMRTDLAEIAAAASMYSADFFAYPPDDITLVAGSPELGASETLVRYLGVPAKGCRACYLLIESSRLTDEDRDGFPEYRDPWGGAYVYARRTPAPDPSDGEMPPRFFDIASPGPDGLLGGEMVPGKGYVPATTREGKAAERDNITNW